ncbi:MAG: pilus assembly protein PilM, partial [Candidatus Omnitrophica bacterium]|nr:pilus assembly protein PilM [Candidatus Omnitrophota bacterium]
LLPFGYSNLLEKYFPREKAPVAILHIEDSISYMGIYLNGKLDFFREIPVSVNKFKESLKGVLVSDKGRIELNVTEIEEVLFKIGIPKEEVTYQDKVSSIQILSMLRICLEQLESEIKRSLTYYVSGLGGEQPGKVFIAGGASRIPNLDNFLKEELKLDISNLTLSNEFAFSTSIDTKILPEIYADIGLALNYGKGANLVPYEFRAEKIEKLEKISLRWIAFIVFLLLFVSYFFAKVGVAAYKKKFDNTVIHLNALSSVKEIKLKIDDLNSFIGDTRKKGIPTVKILKIVSNVTPKELFIRDLTLRSENKSGTIKGVVKSMGENPDKILSKFIRSMEESRYFKNANISSVQKKKEESFDVTDFQISFKLP